jgi:hypothetical protein
MAAPGPARDDPSGFSWTAPQADPSGSDAAPDNPEVAEVAEIAEIGAASVSDGDDDPYFAELRRAVSAADPLGPRPDDNPPARTSGSEPPSDELYGPDPAGSRRFGGRLRRRL